jgi:hypothetical protein
MKDKIIEILKEELYISDFNGESVIVGYDEAFTREELRVEARKLYPIKTENDIDKSNVAYERRGWVKGAKWVISKGLKQVREERIEEIFDANSSMGRAMSYNGFKAALKELNNK